MSQANQGLLKNSQENLQSTYFAKHVLSIASPGKSVLFTINNLYASLLSFNDRQACVCKYDKNGKVRVERIGLSGPSDIVTELKRSQR